MRLARTSLLLIVPALACARPASTDAPTDSAEGAGHGAVDPNDPPVPAGDVRLVGVHQLAPPSPEEWRFSPTSQRVAASVGLDCGVWDIPSGSFIESVADEPDSPCQEWLEGDALFGAMSSVDGALAAEIDGRSFSVTKAASGERLQELRCGGCEEVLELAFAPDGKRVAALVDGPPAIEIWDLGSGQRVREEPLGVSEPITQAALGWNAEGVAAVVEVETKIPCEYGYDYDCDYDEDGELQPVDGPALSTYVIPTHGGPLEADEHTLMGAVLDEAYPTPGLSHLFVVLEDVEPRDGISYTLVDVAPMGHESGLSWGDYSSDWSEELEVDRNGHWRADVSTQWVEGTVTSAYDDGGGWMVLSWETLVTHPAPMIYGDTLFEEGSEEPSGSVEVYGVAKGSALVDWEACGLYDLPEDDDCQRNVVLSPECVAVEDEPASPGLDLILAVCGGQLSLVEAGPHRADGRGAGAVRHRLAMAPDVEHRWGGEGWLALLDSSGRFVALDPASGMVGFERHGVDGWAPVALDNEHNLLGLDVEGGLELVDMRSGKTRVTVPDPKGVVGLSPDGERLAGIVGESIEVWSMADGKALASFPASEYEQEEEVFDVAWRQDGGALLLGSEVPVFAIDVETGEQLETYDILDWYELDAHAIDPSWRWIHMPDRSIVRTLDMRRLHYGTEESGWARLDTGEYSGELSSAERDLGLMRYRAVEDTNEIPRVRHEQLARWLERPGLVSDFFAGAPFPPVHIPESDYRQLVAEDSQ